MRRTSLAVLAVTALLAAPASAKPAATISDPKGDWGVASEDVLAARLEGVVGTSGRTVTATVTLAGAPDAATTYYVAAIDGVCNSWEFSVYGLGTAAQAAVLTRYSCQDAATDVLGTSVPATATVKGNTVGLTAPYALGLKRGTKVAALVAAAAVHYVAFGVGMDADLRFVDGDWAQGGSRYVLP
jgi:hypothetical protein